MRNTVYSYIDRFRHDRHQRLVLGSVLLILAVIVSVSVYWQLRYVGITMTNETYCGYEEHVHTDDCYEYTLICGLEESEGHTHTDECYEEQLVLICELEESEGHTHSESCYDEEGNLICGLEESEGHTHTAECYETQTVLICELEESEGHTHTDDCYEKTLICELEEHTHTVECLIDLNADVEDATVWEATLPELTGDLRTDVVAIAYSQIGYTESTANYSIGEDEVAHYGYTRYGEWYGSIYADWDSIFVAFCLDYAGIEDEFTYNAGAYAWSVDLTNLGYYQSADSYSPTIGDVVFIDADADGRANVSAIVTSVGETSITVIQGNYSLTDSEGNTTDRVAYVTYSTVVDVTGSELTTLSSGSETETVEITPVILGYANISPEAASEEVVEETEDEPTVDETEVDETGDGTEEATEEVALEDDSTDSPEETAAEEETEAGETLLMTVASTDYVTQVTELYTLGMSLTTGDTSTAATIWDTLMTIWEQIYAEEEAGTLTLTAEEYDNVNALTDEVYYYFVETVGYDPYEVATLVEIVGANSTSIASSIYTGTSLDDSAEISGSTVSWAASNVSYDDGSFEMTLNTTFEIKGTDLVSGQSYYIYLPEDFYVSDDAINYGQRIGYDSNGYEAFYYYYKVDSNGNYYIEIVFENDYVTNNSASAETLYGKINFTEYYIDEDSPYVNPGSTTVTFNDGLSISVPTADIDHEENESWVQDLTITKSASSYDSTNNSITYTIYVSSNSGTGAISIEDLISFVNNQQYTDDLSIKSISVDSVKYEQYVLNYQWNEWYSSDGWVSSSVTEDSTASIKKDTDTGSVYQYTVTEDSDSNITGMTIILAPLAGESEYTDSSGTYETSYDRYAITYTVTFDSITGAVNESVTNTATATSEKDGDKITDEATATKTVITSTIDKTGSFDSTTGYITWTITYNSGNAEIAGQSILDSMFADAVGGIEVSIAGGTTSSGTYEYVTDSDGNIVGIKFLPVDTDGDNEPDSNTYSYTITYKTTVGMGSTGNYVNDVDITDSSGSYLDEKETTVSVGDFGTIDKEVEVDETSRTSSTVGLNWTSTIDIPDSGITSGTIIADYLGKSQYGDNYSYYTLSSLYQYFTYTQLTDFMKGLYGDDGKITVTYSDNSTKTYPYIQTTTGGVNGNETIYNYTIQVYAFDAYGNTVGWVDYGNSGTYENYKFTAWRITLNTDIAGAGTIEWSYSTTADTSNIETSRTYANTIYVGKTYATAHYTENNTVYKTDGYGNSNDTSSTITDGVVTWKVYVYVGDLDSNSGELKIVDTLPDGVDFTSVTVQFGYSGSVTLDNNSGTLSGTFNSGSITGSVSNGVVTVEIPYDAYASITTSYNPYVILTYTTSIKGWGDSDEFYTEVAGGNVPNADVKYDSPTYTYTKVYSENNKVVVYLDNNKYGEDEQKQDITHTYVEEGFEKTYTHDKVNKLANVSFGVENLVKYEVVLNLDGETLNNGYDLTFTDILVTYKNTTQYLEAELIYNSVAFYKLYKLVVLTDNGDGTYDYGYETTTTTTNVNGEEETVTTQTVLYEKVADISTWYSTDSNIYAYTESDEVKTYYYMEKLNIDWDFSVYLKEYNYTDYNHELTAQVPDSTPILVKYNYYVTYEETGTNTIIYLSNTATLSGTYELGRDNPDETGYNYKEPTSSASITNAGGLTIVKSGAHTSNFVEGVTFALWKYDTTKKIWVDTGERYTTNASGTVAIVPGEDKDGDNVIEDGEFYPWYSPNTLYYIVETSTPEGYLLDSESKYYFYWYDSTADPVECPDGWDNSTTVSEVTTTSGTRLNIYNQPITTFTLTKVSSSNSSTTIAGAVFGLYRWSGSRNAWVKIGTYTTDASGKITITYDDDTFDYNRAYKITEETTAEGYNIAWEDVTEFYFYWSSDDNGGTVIGPDDWAAGDDGKHTYTALDLTDGSKTVYATNSPTASTIAVKKIWIDENGKIVEDTNGYSSTVQLYYYVGYADGTPVRLTTSTPTSTVDRITLTTTTGVVANTEVVFASGTSMTVDGTATNKISNKYGKLSVTKAEVISAIFDDSYTDAYLAVTVQNSSNPNSLQAFIEGTYYADDKSGADYILLTSRITPSNVETDGNTSVVYFSLSELRSSLESNEDVLDYMDRYNCSIQEALEYSVNYNTLWNSIDIWTTDSTDNNITLSSFKFVGSAYVADQNTNSADFSGAYKSYVDSVTGETVSNPGGGTWFYGSSHADNVLADGAVLRIYYTQNDSSSQINLNILATSGGSSKTVTLTGTSGYVDVLVSDIVDTSSVSVYQQVYVQSNIWGGDSVTHFTGTITRMDLLLPASSESITRTYTYAVTEDTSVALSTDWGNGFLSKTDKIINALQTKGAVIYINYTCTAVPSSAEMRIQYSSGGYSDYDTYNSILSQISVDSGYIAVPVSSILSGDYSLSDYNKIFIYDGDSPGSETVTVTSVSILVPYTVTESISGVISSGTYSITLYDPDLGGAVGGSVAISNTKIGQWNAITSKETEPTYDYVNVDSTVDTTVITGYVLLDAIYADLASTIEITLSNVSSTNLISTSEIEAALKNLSFIIQGDKSVGNTDTGYVAIATVTPEDAYQNTDGTYTIIYSTDKIISSLKSFNNAYVDAASVFADYNAVCLSMGYNDSTFTANVTGLKVVSQQFNTADFYTYSSLVGYDYGVLYTDDTNPSGYTFTLDNSNDWTVAVSNLPLTYTYTYVDSQTGETVTETLYRYYYFVETSHTGGSVVYTTTYSQREGENGGG
ncbi:MAG: hypothetical protein LUH23_00005, partial [Oscillospiraceae bacterium]|nr:hypothetical protein [Oscillospiraceae bacterium]